VPQEKIAVIAINAKDPVSENMNQNKMRQVINYYNYDRQGKVIGDIDRLMSGWGMELDENTEFFDDFSNSIMQSIRNKWK